MWVHGKKLASVSLPKHLRVKGFEVDRLPCLCFGKTLGKNLPVLTNGCLVRCNHAISKIGNRTRVKENGLAQYGIQEREEGYWQVDGQEEVAGDVRGAHGGSVTLAYAICLKKDTCHTPVVEVCTYFHATVTLHRKISAPH